LKKIEVNSTVKGSFWKKLKSILQWKGVWKGNLLKKKANILDHPFLNFCFQKTFQKGWCGKTKVFRKFCTFGWKKPFALVNCTKCTAKMFNPTFVLSLIPFMQKSFTKCFVWALAQWAYVLPLLEKCHFATSNFDL